MSNANAKPVPNNIKLSAHDRDYSNKEEPSDWFTEFQLSLPMTWMEAVKVDQFSLQLAAGSYAEEWFMDLPSRDKVDMAVLKTAFLKRWLPTKRPKWTKSQQREQITSDFYQPS
ncbi:hypothetical protein EDC04DRAFT_2611230 [Pisolithus marmoratus]|nr:hypothetical protein EDC04DRAFT_2611230 [Pisolithus marmoratus]